ncbi:hypothetical protein BTJ49_05650 [Oleiagrimonas sp. MCCC 1A03011]|nr:hypothetical protein BTJ49_05650 [Oleiagrimonas sp. MCCC 1A03011]
MSSTSLSQRIRRRARLVWDNGMLSVRALRMRILGVLSASRMAVSPQPADADEGESLSVSEERMLRNADHEQSVGIPLASVIIPVYNHCDDTLRCLRALSRARTRASFEIIVVDDGSSDGTAEALQAMPEVRLLRRERNAGFVAACNAGAEAAHGRFLVFLNNDTEVADDWLDTLLLALLEDRSCGLAGSKLIYPDGVLQEAGGIVFSDARASNYGRGEHPEDPRFNYKREVDYCSGAAIAIERDLFRVIGGFDTRYAPAYYEDTDLAFSVRARGLKVIYQPRSRVTHYEGRTAGTDPDHGVKRFQQRNRRLFLEKWSKALQDHPSAENCAINAVRCADHRACSRVLVMDASCPRPERDSGSMRMFNMLALLKEAHHHVMFWPTDGDTHGAAAHALEHAGIELVRAASERAALRWFFAHGRTLDSVILSRLGVADRFMRMAKRYAPTARIVFDTVDLHFLRLERGAALRDHAGARREAEALKRRELACVRKADVTLVVSKHELDVLSEMIPSADVQILANVHDIHGRRVSFADRRDLVFLGNFEHEPNVDAVQFLAERIMPFLRTRLDGVTLHVIGHAGKEHVGEFSGEDVVVHGFVEDLSWFMDQCRVALAPLRYGAGVKGKVNMAMSFGLPVVASSIAVEGMALADGRDVLVADAPEAFSDAVTRLYRDGELWQKLSDAGLDNVRRHFSHERARHALGRIFPSARP